MGALSTVQYSLIVPKSTTIVGAKMLFLVPDTVLKLHHVRDLISDRVEKLWLQIYS
jgi:hypothetical protein